MPLFLNSQVSILRTIPISPTLLLAIPLKDPSLGTTFGRILKVSLSFTQKIRRGVW